MEERIRVHIVSITAIRLFVNWVSVHILVRWANHKVGSGKNKAIGWNLGTGVKDNDVTDNKLPNADGRVSIYLSSDDSDGIFLNKRLELNESSIFSPVSY